MIAAFLCALATAAGTADERVALGPGVVQETLTWDGRRFAAVQIDLDKATLHLFWKDPDGTRFGTFERLRAELAKSGKHLVFAANAGIFEPGFKPTGLHVDSGLELVPLNRRRGEGNFYLQPNGVFYVDAQARIVQTSKYPGTGPALRLATQSGPMLVLNGKTNSLFDPHSRNTRIRSGVGVADARHVWFVLSQEPVTFFQLASVFKEKLGCPNALYLDGAISKFYPTVERSGGVESEFGGILAVVSK